MIVLQKLFFEELFIIHLLFQLMNKVNFCRSELYFFVNVVNQRMFIVRFLGTHHSASFVIM